MNAFIIMYNRLEWPKKLASDLTKAGLNVVLIDNNSTYQPLLDWYYECPYKVVMMDKNYGHQVLFNHPELIGDEKYYIVTDPDLDISNLPSDWVSVLKNGLDMFPDIIKCGLSLRIDDLPVNNYTKAVIEWEKKYWERPKTGIYYHSEIDTTLAIYHKDRDFGKLPNNEFFKAVRADEPYCAKHLPWYLTPETMTDEDKFYSEISHGYWNEKYKELI